MWPPTGRELTTTGSFSFTKDAKMTSFAFVPLMVRHSTLL
jgi:hypothetical protein